MDLTIAICIMTLVNSVALAIVFARMKPEKKKETEKMVRQNSAVYVRKNANGITYFSDDVGNKIFEL